MRYPDSCYLLPQGRDSRWEGNVLLLFLGFRWDETGLLFSNPICSLFLGNLKIMLLAIFLLTEKKQKPAAARKFSFPEAVQLRVCTLWKSIRSLMLRGKNLFAVRVPNYHVKNKLYHLVLYLISSQHRWWISIILFATTVSVFLWTELSGYPETSKIPCILLFFNVNLCAHLRQSKLILM